MIPNPVARGGWPGGRPGVAAGSGGARGTVTRTDSRGRTFVFVQGNWWPTYVPWGALYGYAWAPSSRVLEDELARLRRRLAELEDEVFQLRLRRRRGF